MNPTPNGHGRAAAQAAIVVGYGLALVPLFLGIFDDSYLAWWRPIPRVVALVVLLATPPTIAMLGLRKRRGMLLAAGAIGVASFFAVRSIVLLPFVILGVIWLVVYVSGEREFRMAHLGSAVLATLLWVAASLALWVHLDPICEQRMLDGTVVTVDASARGHVSGWVWQVDTSGETSSGPIGSDVSAQSCTSDTVTPLEAVVVIALCGSAVLSALALARAVPDRATPAVS